MVKIYIYSTLTSDQVYANYRKTANGIPVAESKILIKGGANLMTKALVTPHGAVTEVTPDELAALRKNDVFKLHQDNGFITVSESKSAVEAVAADMTARDQSAPIVEQDELTPEPSDFDFADAPVSRRGRPRKD